MHKRLDVKSQRWAHACNIFVVEFFQYGSLPGIVKTATPGFIWIRRFPVDVDDLQEQQSHLLLLLPVLPYYSEQPHQGSEVEMIHSARLCPLWAVPGADRAGAPHSHPTVYFLPPLRLNHGAEEQR